jgi:glycosyltransferase involved in cell wall biosynthesis
MDRRSSFLLGLAERLLAVENRDGPKVARRAVREVRAFLRAAAIGTAARVALRRSPPDTDVVSGAFQIRPIPAAVAYGSGRIIHHYSWPAPSSERPATLAGRLLDAWARRCEARRRRDGGGMRIACTSPDLVEQWSRRTPYLEPVRLHHAVLRTYPRIDDARAHFGIAPDARVALVFGTDHDYKSLDTVWEAFAGLEDRWTLLVVGTAARSYEAWHAVHGSPRAVVVGGNVEAGVRSRAYSAADLVVLSFRVGQARDSAVLQEALAFGLPVVCSDRTHLAERVERDRLGITFVAEDAAALVEALGRAPTGIDPDDLAAARAASSALTVAREHLDALDALEAGPPRDQAGAK